MKNYPIKYWTNKNPKSYLLSSMLWVGMIKKHITRYCPFKDTKDLSWTPIYVVIDKMPFASLY
jgi:hypothetical protein